MKNLKTSLKTLTALLAVPVALSGTACGEDNLFLDPSEFYDASADSSTDTGTEEELCSSFNHETCEQLPNSQLREYLCETPGTQRIILGTSSEEYNSVADTLGTTLSECCDREIEKIFADNYTQENIGDIFTDSNLVIGDDNTNLAFSCLLEDGYTISSFLTWGEDSGSHYAKCGTDTYILVVGTNLDAAIAEAYKWDETIRNNYACDTLPDAGSK